MARSSTGFRAPDFLTLCRYILKNGMKCKECNSEYKEAEGVAEFCSRSCCTSYHNRQRSHSEETKSKISESVSESLTEKYDNDEDFAQKMKAINGSEKKINKLKQTWKEKLLNEDFDSLSWESKRKRVIIEQDEKCAKCGNSEWLGETITLEIHHIDGKSDNRDNLRALCPNCHSMTNDWRGKGKASLENGKKVSDLKLAESLETNPNIRQALLEVGMAGKGANYDRAKQVMNKYDITP